MYRYVPVYALFDHASLKVSCFDEWRADKPLRDVQGYSMTDFSSAS